MAKRTPGNIPHLPAAGKERPLSRPPVAAERPGGEPAAGGVSGFRLRPPAHRNPRGRSRRLRARGVARPSAGSCGDRRAGIETSAVFAPGRFVPGTGSRPCRRRAGRSPARRQFEDFAVTRNEASTRLRPNPVRSAGCPNRRGRAPSVRPKTDGIQADASRPAARPLHRAAGTGRLERDAGIRTMSVLAPWDRSPCRGSRKPDGITERPGLPGKSARRGRKISLEGGILPAARSARWSGPSSLSAGRRGGRLVAGGSDPAGWTCRGIECHDKPVFRDKELGRHRGRGVHAKAAYHLLWTKKQRKNLGNVLSVLYS